MNDLTEALSMIGRVIGAVVGNIAEFFMGPLPKYLLRLGIPYLILLGVALVASAIFSLTGFITLVSPISILIALVIVGILMLMAFLFKRGGQHYDSNQ